MNEFKTRVTALLDAHGISYRLLPHAVPAFTVEEAAAQRGVHLEEMVKSILLSEKKRRRFVMACVTGDARLDPQAVRAHLSGNWKRLSFATADDIRNVTGYVQGAVAPLDLPVGIPVVFDRAIARCAQVNISSGDPRAGLEIDPADLIRLAQASLASIAEKSDSP